jgi:hypothetical protein
MELIGKANLRTVGLFQERARSQAPFLHRHYPASSVLRACPPPHTAESAPHGVLVESHDLSPLGLPVFRAISMCLHAVATTPAGPWGLVVQRSPRRRPSPHSSWVGSRIMPFRGLLSVHSGYGLPARGVAYATLFHRRLQRFCYLHRRSDYYRLERQLPGGTHTR